MRHDSNDLVGLPVDLNRLTDRSRIRVVATLPEFIRDDRDPRPVRMRILFRAEHAPPLHGDAKGLHVVRPDKLAPHPLGLAAGDVELEGGIDPDIGEHGLRIAKHDVLRI